MAKSKSKSGKLQIRDYKDDDRSGLLALWERCGLLTWWNNPGQDIDLFQTAPGAALFVGLRGKEVVASVAMGHDGHRGWVYYLGVDPKCRARGYGQAIMHHGEAWLAAQGAPKVQLLVRDSNLAVKRFYAAIGYRPNSCHIMQRWLDGRAAPEPEGVAPNGELEVTVTYLEMTGRSHHPHVSPPQSMKLTLLRAKRPPLAFYRYLYASVGEKWLWYERRQMDDDTLTAIIHDERVEIYVLYADGVPAGFAELDRRQPPEIDLAFFGLMPPFIGKGLGLYLLTWAIDTAWNYEPTRLTVNTCSLDHPKALAIYQQCGFTPYRQEVKVIADPRAYGLISAALAEGPAEPA